MKEDFMLMPFSSDESLEATSLLSPQRQQEWPRGVLALLDSVRDRAYVYSMGFASPVKEMEGNSAPNILVIDDLEAFLHVGSLRYEQGDLDTALRIVRQGRGVLITPAVARQFDLQVGSEWMLTTRRGRVSFHVAAVALTPFWAPIVSRADAETYLGASVPFGYFVTARLDNEREMVRARLQDKLQAFPHYKLFDIGPDSELTQISIGRVWNTLTVLLNALTVLALIIATVGQTNTMMASVIERVRELGVLRSVGLTRRQVQMARAAGSGLRRRDRRGHWLAVGNGLRVDDADDHIHCGRSKQRSGRSDLVFRDQQHFGGAGECALGGVDGMRVVAARDDAGRLVARAPRRSPVHP